MVTGYANYLVNMRFAGVVSNDTYSAISTPCECERSTSSDAIVCVVRKHNHSLGTERGQQSSGNSEETHDGCCFSDP